VKKQRPIPDEILIAALNEIHDKVLCPNSRGEPSCCDQWGEEECTLCRRICGPEYQFVESDYIKKRGGNLRKSYRLKGTRAARKAKYVPSESYLKYLKEPHWIAFRERVLKFWSYRCCLCMSEKKLDVHHRTYERKGREELTDCVVLCRKCHNRVHGVMVRPDDNSNGHAHNDRMLF